MATGATTKYFLPYPLSTDPVRVAGDIEQLATRIDNILNEEIEDSAALMWTGGTFTNGLTTPTYNDSTGKMSMSLVQDLQTTATPTFAGVNLIGGDLYLGQSRTLIFEGSSNDSFKTTLTVANPTANRTITFQNVTGTVALTSESTLASLINIASATGTLTIQMGYGATTTGTTKTINIGGNGVSGSTTNINIGSSVSGALGTTNINSSSVSIPSSSISIGVITSGTWNGSNIALNKGGTGSSLTAVNGGIIYSTASGMAVSTAGTAGQVLTSNGSGAPTWSALPGATEITLSGDATGTGTSAITVTLSNSGVSAATYGSSTAIPVITVDAKGRITSASNQAIDIDPMPQILMMAGM
jgi:hypothetical protein